MIRISGEDYGCITTNESYSNYKLTVEFKWGEKTWGNRKDKARDSGVLIHSFGKDGGFGGIWMLSVEANVVEGGIGDFWIVGGPKDGVTGTCKVRTEGKNRIFDPEKGTPVTITSNGQGCFRWKNWDPNWADQLNFKGTADLESADGWTTMTVIARANTMTVYVNGVLVNEVTGLGQESGQIQLQSEGAEIFYRKVTLEPLK